jgi:hypothetical protein
MSEEKPIIETLRESDIYRQYAVTLLACNAFYYDKVGEKFSMIAAQQQLSILGGIANNYLEKRVGIGNDEKTARSRHEVTALTVRQKSFVILTPDKTTDYNWAKLEAIGIIEEYDRLLIKHGVCK